MGEMSRFLKSPCCNADVHGMVDVTAHPRFYQDGSAAPIADRLVDIQRAVDIGDLNPKESYCSHCGKPVTVPRPSDARLSGAEKPR